MFESLPALKRIIHVTGAEAPSITSCVSVCIMTVETAQIKADMIFDIRNILSLLAVTRRPISCDICDLLPV
jgi:hypothetical protein